MLAPFLVIAALIVVEIAYVRSPANQLVRSTPPRFLAFCVLSELFLLFLAQSNVFIMPWHLRWLGLCRFVARWVRGVIVVVMAGGYLAASFAVFWLVVLMHLD